MEKIIEIENLSVLRSDRTKSILILNDINFFIKKGEMFCLVGESGSGKTTLALSIIRLLPKNFKVVKGKILFEGKNLFEISEKEIRNIRGEKICIIFQEPGAYLDPLFSAGIHLQESLHRKTKNREELINQALMEVGLEPEIQSVYPHQLSGGQQQRVMIAMALINKPSLIIADEPTTALDILTTHQIINLLNDIKVKHNPGMLLITHDLNLALSTGNRIGIMYKGNIVEIFRPKKDKPLHPYADILMGTIKNKEVKLETISETINDEQNICPFYDRCPEKKPVCKKRIPFIWLDDETGFRCIKNGRDTSL